MELSFYGGLQSAPPSTVTLADDPIIPDASFTVPWVGQSLQFPIYVGLRATYWRSDTFGFGYDYAHNKAFAGTDVLPSGYRALEFTDGLNTHTINAYRRWPDAWGRLTPYVGAGAGVEWIDFPCPRSWI